MATLIIQFKFIQWFSHKEKITLPKFDGEDDQEGTRDGLIKSKIIYIIIHILDEEEKISIA
jgi:hypothetical protein